MYKVELRWGMYIRETLTRRTANKTYQSVRLVESRRAGSKVQQKTLFNLQRFPIKFKLSGPAANLGARHGPAGIVRFGGTAVLFRRLPGR